MRRKQQGFTLIETVIAFTILTMGTVLVVNVITQSSTRVSKVNEHLVAMDTLESAVAIMKVELRRKNKKKTYGGVINGEYQWAAKILDSANQATQGEKQYINLYRVQIQVFHNSEKPRLQLTAIMPDR